MTQGPATADGPPLDAIVVGAGPYGMSATAYLRAAGFDTHVLGEPMGFWQRHMPLGMQLVSTVKTTDIAAPAGALTFADYAAERGETFSDPLPREAFVDYGLWFQRRAVPDVDRRHVSSLKRAAEGFLITLEDGESLTARRVVIAVGTRFFAELPAPFDAVDRSLATHSSEHHDFTPFAGRRVLVVGAGQSAMTSAALLQEAGARVEVLVRGPQLYWAERRMYHRLGRFRRIAYAPTEVGPAGLSWVVGVPRLFSRLPDDFRTPITMRATRPCGALWLRDRVAPVAMTTGATVVAAEEDAGGLRVWLADGSERAADHAILATGFPVNVDRIGFLAPALRAEVARTQLGPQLRSGFESSVPGLHFVGAAAAGAFGPVMRFVSGTRYTGRTLVRAFSRTRAR